jgi:hypothetical protein
MLVLGLAWLLTQETAQAERPSVTVLGVKPGFSICKKRTGSPDGWYILHSSLGATKYVALNS